MRTNPQNVDFFAQYNEGKSRQQIIMKGGIVMKKQDIHIVVAMLATFVSMLTVMAMKFMRFLG